MNQQREGLPERPRTKVQGAIGGTVDAVVKLEAGATFTRSPSTPTNRSPRRSSQSPARTFA